jgi:hypothetical protein
MLTLRRPTACDNMYTIGKRLQEIPDCSPLLWIGRVRRGTPETVTRFLIPSSVWSPETSSLSGVIKTEGIIHPFCRGKDKFEWRLLQVPGVSRTGVVPLLAQGGE